MKTFEFVEKIIEEKSTRIIEANDRKSGNLPNWHIMNISLPAALQFLKDEGFTVETGLAGIPTCFQGTYSMDAENRSLVFWENMTPFPV